MRFLPDGSLDPEFSDDGIIDLGTDRIEVEFRLYPHTDGRITVYLYAGGPTGHGVFHFLPDGTPDPSYGVNGLADIPVSLISGTFSTMLPDGRVLLSYNFADGGLGILCVTNEGTVDPDFGGTGHALPGITSQF